MLLLIDTTDVMFAVDSIPAALGVSQDRLVLFISNVLAVLGCGALYVLLAALDTRFAYLHQGMAVILGFVGIKMVLSGVVEVPIALSLSVIAMVLAVSVLASVRQRAANGSRPRRLPRVSSPGPR